MSYKEHDLQTHYEDRLLRGVESFIEVLREQSAASPVGDTTLELVYAIGRGFYTQQDYQKALPYFFFLFVNRPLEIRFLVAISQTEKKLGHFDEAIMYRSLAAFLEPNCPEHLIAVAEFQIQTGTRKEAEDTLRVIERFCRNAQTDEQAIQRTLAIAQVLQLQKD